MYEDMKVKDNNFLKEYMKEVKAFYEAMIALDDDEYKEIKRSSEDKKASTHTSLPSHRNLIPIRGVSWGGMVARTHIWIVETNISIWNHFGQNGQDTILLFYEFGGRFDWRE